MHRCVRVAPLEGFPKSLSLAFVEEAAVQVSPGISEGSWEDDCPLPSVGYIRYIGIGKFPGDLHDIHHFCPKDFIHYTQHKRPCM